MELTIFSVSGRRKYLTGNEMDCFTDISNSLPLCVRCFCLTIVYTGCRISEALGLTSRNIDFEAQTLIVKCLKKRGRTVYRAIPLPVALLDLLRHLVDQISNRDERLWPWSRMTGYRRIREVMDRAGIVGEHASPKGLRHGFAVQAIQANVPLTLVQRWLGHADLKTTAIYTSAMGAEERKLAARMWQGAKDAEDKAMPPEAPEQSRKPPTQALQARRTATPADTAVRYRLRHVPAVSIGDPVVPAHAIRSRTGSSHSRDLPKKGLLGRLLACVLIHYWLKGSNRIY